MQEPVAGSMTEEIGEERHLEGVDSHPEEVGQHAPALEAHHGGLPLSQHYCIVEQYYREACSPKSTQEPQTRVTRRAVLILGTIL